MLYIVTHNNLQGNVTKHFLLFFEFVTIIFNNTLNSGNLSIIPLRKVSRFSLFHLYILQASANPRNMWPYLKWSTWVVLLEI